MSNDSLQTPTDVIPDVILGGLSDGISYDMVADIPLVALSARSA